MLCRFRRAPCLGEIFGYTSVSHPLVTLLSSWRPAKAEKVNKKHLNNLAVVIRHTVLCCLYPNKTLFMVFVYLVVGKRWSESKEIWKQQTPRQRRDMRAGSEHLSFVSVSGGPTPRAKNSSGKFKGDVG